jgi:hypothetical protein
MMRDRVGSHPSLPKTLPPTTMGFGETGTDTDLFSQLSLITKTEMPRGWIKQLQI